MRRIALVFTKTHPLPSYDYAENIDSILIEGAPDGGNITGSQEHFNPVVFFHILNKQTKQNVTKRGRFVKHTLNKRRQHIIKISSNEITQYYINPDGISNNDKMQFLIDFFNADYQYISFNTLRREPPVGEEWLNYIPVVIDNDSFQPEYLKNNLRFPEVSLILNEEMPYDT